MLSKQMCIGFRHIHQILMKNYNDTLCDMVEWFVEML